MGKIENQKSLFEIYKETSSALSDITDSADYETSLLIQKHFSVTRSRLLSSGIDIIPDADAVAAFFDDVKKRKNHEPLQYILGKWEFFGIEFAVARGVLIPRADTEILVEQAIAWLKEKQCEDKTKKLRVLDLCSGTGCIAVAVAKNVDNISVEAVEHYPDAYRLLCENIKNTGAEVTPIKADVLLDGKNFDRYDLILSNPPYIRQDVLETLDSEVKNEPMTALDGGKDGLVFYRALTNEWADHLFDGGALMVEIGFDQKREVEQLFSKKFISVNTVRDLGGNDRVVKGIKKI